MEVEIDSHGTRIRVYGIDCDEAEDCIEVAIRAWRKVRGRPNRNRHAGPAMGFQLNERSEPSVYGWADFGVNEQPVVQ